MSISGSPAPTERGVGKRGFHRPARLAESVSPTAQRSPSPVFHASMFVVTNDVDAAAPATSTERRTTGETVPGQQRMNQGTTTQNMTSPTNRKGRIARGRTSLAAGANMTSTGGLVNANGSAAKTVSATCGASPSGLMLSVTSTAALGFNETRASTQRVSQEQAGQLHSERSPSPLLARGSDVKRRSNVKAGNQQAINQGEVVRRSRSSFSLEQMPKQYELASSDNAPVVVTASNAGASISGAAIVTKRAFLSVSGDSVLAQARPSAGSAASPVNYVSSSSLKQGGQLLVSSSKQEDEDFELAGVNTWSSDMRQGQGSINIENCRKNGSPAAAGQEDVEDKNCFEDADAMTSTSNDGTGSKYTTARTNTSSSFKPFHLGPNGVSTSPNKVLPAPADLQRKKGRLLKGAASQHVVLLQSDLVAGQDDSASVQDVAATEEAFGTPAVLLSPLKGAAASTATTRGTLLSKGTSNANKNSIMGQLGTSVAASSLEEVAVGTRTTSSVAFSRREQQHVIHPVGKPNPSAAGVRLSQSGVVMGKNRQPNRTRNSWTIKNEEAQQLLASVLK
ncbi:unnamed protein product [Amoebophrya sp. A25]|nr:unnamed protein product [Amoebophrya sp. A25]|eukprot:GSA25T00011963001.1